MKKTNYSSLKRMLMTAVFFMLIASMLSLSSFASGTYVHQGSSAVSGLVWIVIISILIFLVVFVAAPLVIILVCVKKGRKKNAGSPVQNAPSQPAVQKAPVQQPQQDSEEIVFSEEDFPKTTTLEMDKMINGTNNAPVQNKGVLCVVGVGGVMDGRVYQINSSEITIGRGQKNMIAFPDRSTASSSHAKLFWEKGRLMLVDMDSRNGTFLKRIGKLPPLKPVEVHEGDTFFIGERNNRFDILQK